MILGDEGTFNQLIKNVKENDMETTSQCYAFSKDNLWLKKEGDRYRIPTVEEVARWTDRMQPVSLNDGRQVYALRLPETESPGDTAWATLGLRASYDCLPLADYQAAGKAFQILYWDEHSRFCPVCGERMERQTPIMKRCPRCGNEMYPPIATAIIVLVRRDDEVLLVHARNFRGTFYGLVAGFLEAGETLEQCVRREVMEETGLTLRNITYFGSQPWPYPSGLMVGFVADYAGGTIKLQDDELSAGAFYRHDRLPEIPRKLSIARKMIDWWLSGF